VHTQVVLVLRWLRHRLELRTLAGEVGLSIATAYRYLPEALDVIAAQPPDLKAVLASAHAAELPLLCLDGTPIPTARIAARVERGQHRGGIPASTTPAAAACRRSPTPPASRCGSPQCVPARPMT
jgi:hypothetical protein